MRRILVWLLVLAALVLYSFVVYGWIIEGNNNFDAPPQKNTL